MTVDTEKSREHKSYIFKKKLLNIVIKLSLISLIVVILAWSVSGLFFSKGRDFFLSLIASNLLNIEVKPAVISGITAKGLKYNITSESIENYISHFFYKNNVDFSKPVLKLELDNGNMLEMVSRKGELNPEENLFYLKNKVELLSSNGSYLESHLVVLDLSKSEIYSNVKTTGVNNGNYFYSKGFLLYKDFNSLSINGPVVISDLIISEKDLYKKDLFNNIYFRTTDNIEIDNLAKTIKTNAYFFGIKDDIKFSANKIQANYINLSGFKDSDNTFDNFSRIEMNEDIRVYNSKTKGLITGDKYVYDVLKHIMIITSLNDKLTKYEDSKYILTAKDRFEFNTETNIVILRGRPHLQTKDKEVEQQYDIKADLAYAKIESENKDIEYAEMFDNIIIKSYDGSVIYADYGYLDYKENIVYLEDNVRIENEDSKLESCKLILDITTGLTKLVKCEDQESFKTTINNTKRR